MIKRRVLGRLTVGLLLLVFASVPQAARAAQVSIRIEGQSSTLVPRTAVTTPSADLHGDGSCPGATLAGAIEAATKGDWDRAPGGFSNTIKGENHTFTNNDYWAGWVNNTYGNGFCIQPVQDGDDLLVLVDTTDNVTFASAVFPLVVGGLPPTVNRGRAVTVTATEYRNFTGAPGSGTPGVGDPQPSAGVRIAGGGAEATTGADGRATLTFTESGPVTVTAAKAVSGPGGSSFGMRAVPLSTCVDDGNGSCYGISPGASPPYRAPDPEILDIVRRKRYALSEAPRELRGVIHLGTASVKQTRLRLLRKSGRRCQYFSGSVEEFRRATCRKGFFFKVGDREEWSYLLPERLPLGRYELSVRVADAAGQKRTEAVVFFVKKGA
jgi:hypothetical protein